ncbi:MAG: class I SAM-dependent methyltransferase [Porphyromonadaceae bacterium]|nr:class I SAM-dependent methyltransferase [Porphyromonadaceae bacterium]
MTYEERLEEYILQHTTPESPLRKRLWREAHVRLLRARMLSGHLQGNFLQMLCRLKGAKCILELGTYTGYAAHCLAEALEEGGEVHTIESDDEMEDFIRSFIDEAPYKERIHLHLGDALTLLPSLLQRYTFDLVYIDANKREYLEYYELILPHLPSGALILADNTLWDGKVIEEPTPTDAQTQSILRFNDYVQRDPRVENLILPLRDGLSLIYKL